LVTATEDIDSPIWEFCTPEAFSLSNIVIRFCICVKYGLVAALRRFDIHQYPRRVLSYYRLCIVR
jgi:hypothetical protein